MTKSYMTQVLTVLCTANLLFSVRCTEFERVLGKGNGSVMPNIRLDVDGENFEDSFRTINRRNILSCDDSNPYLQLTVNTAGPLANVQLVTVNVSGVVSPSDDDWIGVITPSNSSIDDCADVEALILATGDTSALPLLCHYPVKFKHVNSDPNYIACNNSQCQKQGLFGSCLVTTCTGLVTFELINIRTDILFVLFSGGLQVPCILTQTSPVSFATPNSPLYGHLSSIDSSGTKMRLTWVSGDLTPQSVQYSNETAVNSTVTTFTPADLCSQGPANDFGWHNPGYIHSAVMTGLSPSTQYTYQYGSQTVGLSGNKTFTTPPASGHDNVTLIIYGDMGKADADNSSIHYIQPGSLSVIDAVKTALDKGGIDFIFHIGDISYATGFLVEWEGFLNIIEPAASKVSYMTLVGNHERDQPDSGSYYKGLDSGGECGIPYYNYFQMPTIAQDKPWYSIESGPVHFVMASTEHDWHNGTEQYAWIQSDLASVNRSKTPWIIYSGHRPMYASVASSLLNDLEPTVDAAYTAAIEPLLFQAKVDLALQGHVHNYERLCAVYQGNCLQNATQDASGIDTFNFTSYAAPVQAVIGMAGFTLDPFADTPGNWSTVRISEFGYAGIQATVGKLLFQFSYANGTVGDSFAIVK